MRGLLAILIVGAAEICRALSWRRLGQSTRWGDRAAWCDRQAKSITKRKGESR